MNLILLIGLSITILYVFLMLSLRFGMSKLKPFVLEPLADDTQLSIVIPFRNEAKNLEALLQSLENLDYPKNQFEILLINDDSSDDYLPIIEKYKERLPNLKCLENERQSLSPKKDAITAGINKAKYNWILTTDADCIVPKNWLKAFNIQIQKTDAVLIVGLVKFNFNNSFLERFQTLDILSLQATLLGAFGLQRPILCNGANLCYTKNLFIELNGFSNNNTIASGDDMFLLEETLKKQPDKVLVLNSFEATVATNPEPTFKALLAQRQRWAAKATQYNNATIKGVALLVFIMNLLVLIGAVMSVLGFLNVTIFFILFLVKFNVDAVLLVVSARFFKQEKVMQSYILSSLLYPLFSVLSVLLGLTKGFTWKERQFKK